MRPLTRQKFDTDKRYLIGLLVVVSVLAFLVFSSESNGFAKADTDIAAFAAIWWFTFPYGCAALLLFDRVFDVFTPRTLPVKKADTPTAERNDPPLEAAHSDNVIAFDPKRFS